MAYMFNNGRGAVTCDRCDIIIDEYLSHAEYVEMYGRADEEDVCHACKKADKDQPDD